MKFNNKNEGSVLGLSDKSCDFEVEKMLLEAKENGESYGNVNTFSYT